LQQNGANIRAASLRHKALQKGREGGEGEAAALHLKRSEYHQRNSINYCVGRQEVRHQLLHGQIHRPEPQEKEAHF
jgi:response regulator of citrate/malate metabolism